MRRCCCRGGSPACSHGWPASSAPPSRSRRWRRFGVSRRPSWESRRLELAGDERFHTAGPFRAARRRRALRPRGTAPWPRPLSPPHASAGRLLLPARSASTRRCLEAREVRLGLMTAANTPGATRVARRAAEAEDSAVRPLPRVRPSFHALLPPPASRGESGERARLRPPPWSTAWALWTPSAGSSGFGCVGSPRGWRRFRGAPHLVLCCLTARGAARFARRASASDTQPTRPIPYTFATCLIRLYNISAQCV